MRYLYARTSPFARKALVAAHELEIVGRLELVEVNPWVETELRRHNPFSQVPTLVLDDGEALFDSGVIADYFDELGGRRLYPASGPARRAALKLEAIADGICTAAVRRVREGTRPMADRHADIIERQSLAMAKALDALDGDMDRLSGFGIGEIAVACACGYLDLRFPADEWRVGRPALAAWYARVADRPSMKATEPPVVPPG